MSHSIRIAAAVPVIRVADVAFNAGSIAECARSAVRDGAGIVFFPELSLTGCTCGDLFRLKFLTDAALEAALKLAREFAETGATLVVGLPVRRGEDLLSCAAVLENGGIAGLIPLDGQPPFRSGRSERENGGTFALPDGTAVPFPGGFRNDFILDLASSPAEAGRAGERRKSAKRSSAGKVFVCVQPGCCESTTDAVYDGQAIIAHNGKILAETARFSRKSEIIRAEIDLSEPAAALPAEPAEKAADRLDPAPFLSKTAEEREDLCAEIFAIQSSGLARRLESSGAQKAVVGISGGLDSTLALLAAAESLKKLGRTPDSLIAVTMPGFGTTGRTKSNAEKMAEELGCDLRKIDIRAACLQHFQDIGHDRNVLDVTYENAQARERTQILMDVANRERGLVVGTGDLSEIALGWCTFNGDHISMYNVNCGVPKTLIRVIVSWYADHAGERLKNALRDVLATPVSPELLPADPSGKIAQETESILGAYELHDFYLWHFIRLGESPEQIRSAAKQAFAGSYPDGEIDRTLQLFFKRFFTQQFKRSCCADGPHATAVSLSPRTDWHMPSDASAELWLSALEAGSK